MNAATSLAEERLAVADAEHERRVASGGDDAGPGWSGATTTSVNAPSSRAAHLPHGLGQVAVRRAGSRLAATRCATTSVSVSLRSSTPAASSSARSGAKFSMIPLWTTATAPVASSVRVGVAVGRRAVGGPAGVPDAGGAGDPAGWSAASALSRFSIRPARFSTHQPAVEHGDAGGVVAAVLQPAQALEHDVQGLLEPTYPTMPHMGATA